MLAFIIAGLVFVGTLAWCALMLFAAGMSSGPAPNMPVGSTFIIGTIIAVLIAASHWLNISW